MQRQRKSSEGGAVACLTGVVQGCEEDDVHVLVVYGARGESVLCAFHRSLWPEGSEPEKGQECRLLFARKGAPPVVEVVKSPLPRLSVLQQDSIADAREICGFRPGDKVAVVISSIHTPHIRTDVRHNLGWGEGMILTRLSPALFACGIQPQDIEYVLPEQAIKNPREAFRDRHVVFAGSVRSNPILREHFWPHLREKVGVEVPLDGDARLKLRDADGKASEYRYDDRDPDPKDAEEAPHESIHIVDPFFIAVLENPYDEKRYHRCILLCGAGTFGTGYAGVVLTARKTVSLIARKVAEAGNDRPEWWGAWRVDMEGRFNPAHDKVSSLGAFADLSQCVLPNAITAPTFWSADEGADEDVVGEALRRYGYDPDH